MATASNEIRLVVRLANKTNGEPIMKTCLVDKSQGLSSVLSQVSSYFKDDIQRLSHIVYNNTGVEVCVSEIGTVGVLKDFDVIVAASSAAAKDTVVASDDCNKKKETTTANQTVEDNIDIESHRTDVESTPPAVARRGERRDASEEFSNESNDKREKNDTTRAPTAQRQPTGRSVTPRITIIPSKPRLTILLLLVTPRHTIQIH